VRRSHRLRQEPDRGEPRARRCGAQPARSMAQRCPWRGRPDRGSSAAEAGAKGNRKPKRLAGPAARARVRPRCLARCVARKRAGRRWRISAENASAPSQKRARISAIRGIGAGRGPARMCTRAPSESGYFRWRAGTAIRGTSGGGQWRWRRRWKWAWTSRVYVEGYEPVKATVGGAGRLKRCQTVQPHTWHEGHQ